MKEIKSIIFLLSVFLFFYLIGSFYSVSFDIKLWTEFTRFTIVLIGSIASSMSGIMYYFKDKL